MYLTFYCYCQASHITIGISGNGETCNKARAGSLTLLQSKLEILNIGYDCYFLMNSNHYDNCAALLIAAIKNGILTKSGW